MVSLQASPSASDFALRAMTGQDDPTGRSVSSNKIDRIVHIFNLAVA